MDCKTIKRLGVYRLFWTTGGWSVASVGMDGSGKMWFAPSNWLTVPSYEWDLVDRVVLIESYTFIRESGCLT